MLISSGIRIMAGDPGEWRVITDPGVRYRPEWIGGRRYHVTASIPRAGQGSGNGVTP